MAWSMSSDLVRLHTVLAAWCWATRYLPAAGGHCETRYNTLTLS